MSKCVLVLGVAVVLPPGRYNHGATNEQYSGGGVEGSNRTEFEVIHEVVGYQSRQDGD